MDESAIPVSVKGVLLREINGANEVLLLRNDRNEWELPGGRPEAEETPQACLIREILEETGLAVEVGPFIRKGLLTIPPPHVPKTTNVLILAYGCQLPEPADAQSPIALSSEHESAGWIDVRQLSAMIDIPEVYKAAVLSWAQCVANPSSQRA
jgi:8-oxo-dGTP pyrophosphatase MutT (NUDIX family)